jgi:hypothetical protein
MQAKIRGSCREVVGLIDQTRRHRLADRAVLNAALKYLGHPPRDIVAGGRYRPDLRRE